MTKLIPTNLISLTEHAPRSFEDALDSYHKAHPDKRALVARLLWERQEQEMRNVIYAAAERELSDPSPVCYDPTADGFTVRQSQRCCGQMCGACEPDAELHNDAEGRGAFAWAMCGLCLIALSLIVLAANNA